MKLEPNKLGSALPAFFTLVLLMGSAALAVAIGHALLFSAAISAMLATGIIGFAMSFAMMAAQVTIGIALIVFVPLWGLVGGAIFSAIASIRAAGGGGAAGVNLFSDTHPITIRVNELAEELELPKIKWVGWFDTDEINAFAMGSERDRALIAFSKGAIDKLSHEELDAVMAHELAHVVNDDMQRMTLAFGIQNSLTFYLVLAELRTLGRWLFTPLSELELMRFSRQREYWADAIGATLTSPVAMASALVKIAKDNAQPSDKQQQISHFMFQSQASSLFATHPPIPDRVKALSEETYIKQLPLKSEVVVKDEHVDAELSNVLETTLKTAFIATEKSPPAGQINGVISFGC